MRAVIIGLTLAFFISGFAFSQQTRHPMSCPAASPRGPECGDFQFWWDENYKRFYNCPLPAQWLPRCWRPTQYNLRLCPQSPAKINFVELHNRFVDIFRKAHAAGEFAQHENISAAWEHLNAFFMDIPYAVLERATIEADFAKLSTQDAVRFGHLLVKYNNNDPRLALQLRNIFETFVACSNFNEQVRQVMKRVSEETDSQMWVASMTPDEPGITLRLHVGPDTKRFRLTRVDCPSNEAVRPLGVSVFVTKDGGQRTEHKLDIGAGVTVEGSRVTIIAAKGAADWSRYGCALGTRVLLP